MELAGKVALVTGGSRGIGRAICIALAEARCAVAVNYHMQADAAEEVVARLASLGVAARAFGGDVATEEGANILAERVVAEFGHVDVLVNNAGITRDRSLCKMSYAEWREVLQTNLDSAFLVTHALVPQMVTRGWGRVINISSVVGQTGSFGQCNYSATKAGLIAFTKSLARELAGRRITVNAVAPGYIRTDMVAGVPERVLDSLVDKIPVGRLGNPEEVARVVRFLAAPEAAYLTGSVINVNGGLYM